jgi:hypothetical protein
MTQVEHPSSINHSRRLAAVRGHLHAHVHGPPAALRRRADRDPHGPPSRSSARAHVAAAGAAPALRAGVAGRAYFEAARGIVRALRADAAGIGEVAAAAAATVRAGRTVCMNVSVGHMPTFELAPGRLGNPDLFVCQGEDALTAAQWDALEPGDMVITQTVGPRHAEAKAAGVRVVIVTTCYSPYATRLAPAGAHAAGLAEGQMIREAVAHTVLEAHIPAEQGVVRCMARPFLVMCSCM